MRIGLKQKFILTCVFSLVALTIAVTVVRGALVGGIFMSVDNFSNAQLHMSWMWLFTEYSVCKPSSLSSSPLRDLTFASVSDRMHCFVSGTLCSKGEKGV